MMIKKLTRALRILSAITLLTALGACSGGGDSAPQPPPPPPPTSEVPNELVRAAVPAATGATLTVPSDAKALANAVVEIPGDAPMDDISVQVGYEDAAPGPFRAEAMDAGVTQVSKTLVVKVANGGASVFNKLVTVTLPYDTKTAAGLPPAVLYWDPDANAYRPVAVVQVDDAKGTVKFQTSHFSKFVAIVLAKLQTLVPTYKTGFAVGVDSILHQNFGSYQYGGHCAAFASLSSHYFSLHKAQPLFQLAQQGIDNQPFDDELTRTALTLTYSLISQKWQSFAASIITPKATQTGLLVLSSMIATGIPVHFVLHSGTEGHSVTVFGYDAATKQFLIYDSNFPGETTTFPWSLADGFGAYSKHASYPADMFKNIGYASDDTFGAPSQFAKIINDFESKKLLDYFSHLAVTDQAGKVQSLEYDKKVTVALPYQDQQSISGHFSRPAGMSGPAYLHVYIDGAKLGQVATTLGPSGDFKIDFPKKLEQKQEVVLIVSQHPRDIGTGFSGFGRFTAKSKEFFINFGFETGDLTGWTAATTLRDTGAEFQPTKATVVGIGLDPIATDLPTAVFGTHALMVNDSTPDYHSTLVRQRATVPATGNPQLRFQWAAVLEDPQHEPQDQPYVEVTVTDVTKGTTLYQKRFYTNDPSAPGWKDYMGGAWKSIPWQSVELGGLGQYAGDEIELLVRGTDCNLGAHGGYVYLDGEE